MEIKFYFLAFILLCSARAYADTQLERLAKEQQKNDNNTTLENRIDKKDVFSKVEDKNVIDFKLPAEEDCYPIAELILENEFLGNKMIRNIKDEISNTCLGTKGIEYVATYLQDYYIKAGYVTTRVDIPVQNLKAKKLQLNILAGKINKVIIAKDDIRSWILPFTSGDILNLRDIEQGLENLQKVPGVDVKINIVPGHRVGHSDIVIHTNRNKLWNIRTTYNNWGDRSTGKMLTGISGYLYNSARLGDLFYLAGTSSTTGGYKSISAFYSIPVGFWDYEVFYSSSMSRQRVGLSYWDLDYQGKNQYLSLKGTRTFFRNTDKKITGSVEILRRRSAYQLGGVDLALQERDMGNLRLGLNFKQNLQDATLDSSLSWQRFMTWLGGEKTPDMVSGDVNSKSQIFNLNTSYVKWFNAQPLRYCYELNMGAQFSQSPLTLQDQFTIGNRWNVRGFETSAGLDGNKGFYIQNTFHFLIGDYNSELYFGADYGQILGEVYPQNAFDGKRIIGSIIGIKGAIKSLGYDISLSAPLITPAGLVEDRFISNFNITYQL
ncbi:ShlB/FhaC/HecB family hemolysin secretion/activation protein [Kosakonia sp. R1.Fl]|nr:ShlB/FhaC/HecB family hemolysin secretion/activation protein [Kosakonia sp. R1.Fl]MCL6746286.1 ShlB/FhaC/HecB family hemolysin secretion/activation protein [Kosakonia sp. R1.Fl]